MPEPLPTLPAGGPTALPSVRARVVAFTAIVVAGLAGLIIGRALVRIQCHGTCQTATALGGLAGAVLGAAGVAVVAVLALRAMAEWRGRRADHLT